MQKSRKQARRTLGFDSLEGKALMAVVGPLPAVAAVPAQVVTTQAEGDVIVKKDDFNVHAGNVNYTLNFTSGRYKFLNNYDLNIKRVNHNQPDGITATDAMTVFQERLANKLGLLQPDSASGVAAQQEEGTDYVVKSEKLKQSGGYVSYQLTIDSGQYRFKQNYTFKLCKIHNAADTGIGAIDGLYVFQDSLATHVNNYLGLQATAVKKA